MRNKSAKTKNARKSPTLQEILDSDDELPTEYVDLPFVPAYQMDNRFKNIEKVNVKDTAIKQEKEGLSKKTCVVAHGYLNKKDTFCFQCLESNTSEKTQQWFFNFLMIKDLNARYAFLSTCLVPNFEDGYCCGNRNFFKDYNDIISGYKMISSC